MGSRRRAFLKSTVGAGVLAAGAGAAGGRARPKVSVEKLDACIPSIRIPRRLRVSAFTLCAAIEVHAERPVYGPSRDSVQARACSPGVAATRPTILRTEPVLTGFYRLKPLCAEACWERAVVCWGQAPRHPA